MKIDETYTHEQCLHKKFVNDRGMMEKAEMRAAAYTHNKFRLLHAREEEMQRKKAFMTTAANEAQRISTRETKGKPAKRLEDEEEHPKTVKYKHAAAIKRRIAG